MQILFFKEKKLIFRLFFCFLRPAFGHGRLGHPQSLFSPFFAFDPFRGISRAFAFKILQGLRVAQAAVTERWP